MIGFSHALAGIGIALSVRNPVMVAPIALVSHFLLDIAPHFEHPSYGNTLQRPYTKRFKQVLACDTTATLAITTISVLLWPEAVLALIVGVLCAMLPDFLWPLYGKVRCLDKFFVFHLKIQRYERPWGLLVEAPFVLAIALFIFL